MKLFVIVAVRAFTRLTRQLTTVFAVVVFLAAVGVLFANGLFVAEGTTVSAGVGKILTQKTGERSDLHADLHGGSGTDRCQGRRM